MAQKFYAVKKGKTPGIYTSWEECRKMVMGFENTDLEEQNRKEEEPENYAFVDGSFNSKTSVYGYGGFLVTKGSRHVLQGSGNDTQMASMRNVAGEVLGSMAAVKLALELGMEELTIYYDYMGIEMWATGAWKRNRQGTIAYYDFMQSVSERIHLTFVKVKGHSGVEGNEEADRLARLAAGVDTE